MTVLNSSIGSRLKNNKTKITKIGYTKKMVFELRKRILIFVEVQESIFAWILNVLWFLFFSLSPMVAPPAS